MAFVRVVVSFYARRQRGTVEADLTASDIEKVLRPFSFGEWQKYLFFLKKKARRVLTPSPERSGISNGWMEVEVAFFRLGLVCSFVPYPPGLQNFASVTDENEQQTAAVIARY